MYCNLQLVRFVLYFWFLYYVCNYLFVLSLTVFLIVILELFNIRFVLYLWLVMSVLFFIIVPPCKIVFLSNDNYLLSSHLLRQSDCFSIYIVSRISHMVVFLVTAILLIVSKFMIYFLCLGWAWNDVEIGLRILRTLRDIWRLSKNIHRKTNKGISVRKEHTGVMRNLIIASLTCNKNNTTNDKANTINYNQHKNQK